MAFLKFIDETITYPYNTKTDYPHTGFPPGTDYPEFNIFWVYPTSPNPPENNLLTEETPLFNDELNQGDPMYPSFLNPPENNLLTEEAPVFNDELNQGDPMYPTPPNPSEDNSWTEGTPVFNTELNRWEQTWNYTPIAPEPDWTNFNLAMILPETESSFEVWLSQFKPAYQTALTVPAALGQLSETQSAYNTLKTLAAPTTEQIAEWQGIANQFHIGITF